MSRIYAESPESVTLYFQEGGSDKVYTANLIKQGSGWVVTFAYGRRGSTMNMGVKNPSPLDYSAARKIYDKLVAEKTGKGYTPGEGAAAYTATPQLADRDTGVRVQLLNEITEDQVERLLNDDLWGAQEKMDGRRQVVNKTAFNVTGVNRKGLTVALAAAVAQSAQSISGNFKIDGEAIGELVHVFDILEHAGIDIRNNTYLQRYMILESMPLGAGMRLVPLATSTATKRALLQRLRAANAEGIVFKRLDAPYTAGRPNAGGTALKFKFVATGSFLVTKVNAKRSVQLGLIDGIKLGNVTIPPNKSIPAEGAIVEVRYLYAFPGGSLFQPVYLVERDDLDDSACTAAQLKFKAAGADDDDA